MMYDASEGTMGDMNAIISFKECSRESSAKGAMPLNASVRKNAMRQF